MKTPITLVIAVVVVVGAGCVGIAKKTQTQTWECDGGCLTMSGTSVPQPQLGKIINLLQGDSKNPQNYRVAVWENGKRKQTIGQMRIAKAEMATDDLNAKTTGLTALTYRVGACYQYKNTCDPKCSQFIKNGKELEKEICEILKTI